MPDISGEQVITRKATRVSPLSKSKEKRAQSELSSQSAGLGLLD